MYEVEDITEEINDGFLWLSVIEGMTPYRVQLMESSNSQVGYKAIHVYDDENNEVNDEKNEQISKKAEEWANAKGN